MYKYCIVPKCTNTSIKTPVKLFFNVPKDPKLRKKWYSVVKRADKIPPSAKATRHCCEDHFDLEEDMESYVKFKLVGGKLKLKKGVLPHKLECQKPQKKKIDRPGFRKRQVIAYFERVLSQDIGHEDLLLHPIEVVECENQDSNIIQNSDPLNMPEEIDVLLKNNETGQKTQAMQVNMKPKMKTKSNNNNTPIKWKQHIVKKNAIPKNLDPNVSFTISKSNSRNITRFFDVNASDESNNLEITKTMNKHFFNEHMQKGALMAISQDPKLLIGIPAHSYFCIKHLQNFTGISCIQILVTLRKIRWHEPNSMLAIHFGLSESSVTKYLKKTLSKVAVCLNQLIIWPSADVRENLPIAFRKRYSKAISIIDCFDIQIEKPSNASHQALTWSQYKSCNTIKYLVSITPDGLINFISEGYGGRIPDSTIFEDSGFLDKLQPGSMVLADRDFKNISHLLEQRGCTLLRPPSVSSNSKPTAEEVLQAKRIAAIRVHVERSIAKLRDFEMIGPHACIDISYIKILDNIVTIACGLVNLQDCPFNNRL